MSDRSLKREWDSLSCSLLDRKTRVQEQRLQPTARSSTFGSDHRRICWESPRLKGTRTPNHKPICKDLADKKVLNYIQLEDVKDKSFLNRNTFPSAHAKSLANGALSVAAVNSDAQKVFDTVQNYISATKKPICTHTDKYNMCCL